MRWDRVLRALSAIGLNAYLEIVLLSPVFAEEPTSTSLASIFPPNVLVLPVKQYVWDENYYDSSSCKSLGVGTFTATQPPKHGTLSFDTENRNAPSGSCKGTLFPASVAYYTWTGTGSVTSDFFHLHWKSPDGVYTNDGDFSVAFVTTGASWYVNFAGSNYSTLYTWMTKTGIQAASTALKSGVKSNIVILDFGQPLVKHTSSGVTYGASGFTVGQFLTTGVIRTAVESFVKGFNSISGGLAGIGIVIGTSNKFPNSMSGTDLIGHAVAWGNMVNTVNSDLASSSVTGGIDIEPFFSSTLNTPQKAITWVKNFHATKNPFSFVTVNYGSADGCRQSGSTGIPGKCLNGWDQETIYSVVSYSRLAILAIPQIYSTAGGNAKQWQQISLYSSLAHGSAMSFLGPLSQYKACQQKGGCGGTNNTPNAAWYQLWNTLQMDTNTTVVPPFSSSNDIGWRQ
jgi:hypothetical protein